MARHGVDYETVKHAALKLLSKGTSPSVQRVRELLGTGSNSTIAEHLKIWRDAHATKKVHHLPATIPEALVATFETLWQTAMEHAEQHLVDVKESIEAQEEKLNQEKILTDKTIADLKSQLDSCNQKIDDKIRENQVLQTNLAVTSERLKKQTDEIDILKNQFELRLKHLHDEKNQLVDEINKLKTEIAQHTKNLSDQAEKQAAVLAKERALQEESEKRWVLLIDQAKTETKQLHKKYDETVRKQNDKIEELQSNQAKLNELLIETKIGLAHKNELIDSLTQQFEKLQYLYTSVTSELTVAKSKLEVSAVEKVNNRAQHSESV